MVRRLAAAFAAFVCLLAARSEARAEGALVVLSPDGREEANLPLTRTAVEAEVGGQTVSSTVTQRFHNGFSRPIEAVYVFPLPSDAAVDRMEMRIGARVLRATIDRRAQARQRYETARAEGRHAALLEQERPNVFTFHVANIDPGADVDVSLHFFGSATYDHSTYELALPMVVGPRYIPGAPLARAPSGHGAHPDTDAVPDASRISPAYVPPAMRSGHALSVRVRVDAGDAVETIEAIAHEVATARPSASVFEVTLVDKDEVPNRDFVLRWKLAAPGLRASLVAHRADAREPGYLALSLEARHDAPPAEIAARELFFLLDTSGSMQGPPLDAVKAAVTRALTSMQPSDSFQIIDFADSASSLAPRPLAATPDNVRRGLAYLQSLSASGGTNQLVGIDAALNAPADPMRLRHVVFMTDGYIGNEAQVIALTRRAVGNARIFSFGVGASVNRYLLEEVALVGRGHAEFLRPDEDPCAAVERLYARIGRPYLTDVHIDWGGLAVRDALPAAVPDVSALEPITLFARYDRGASGTVTVRGTLGGRPYAQTLAVTLPAVAPANAAVASLWARQRIAALSREEHFAPDDRELPEAITALALRHHLLSRYTSFVAVDDTPGRGNGSPMRVDQPAEAPQGVNLNAAGGAMLGGSIGDAFGYGGLGATGTGWGGGGAGEGTLGLGTLGAMGHGSGVGYGSGYGVGLRGRGAAPPAVRGAAPTVAGMLSPDVIRRVVLRNVTQVRRCYEMALTRTLRLEGRLAVRFTVGPTGAVVADELTAPLGDAAFQQCVLEAVRRWVFPAPAGGGVVTVTYPFNFTMPDPPPAPAAPAAAPALPAARRR
jgi:Ca-activated chloride channel family protein